MRKWMTCVVAMIASASTIASTASAQEMCWRPAEVDAAKVRNMQSMLMVAALECTRGNYGQDHLYDEFVRNNRGSLVGFNDSIKSYYIRVYGPAGGRDAYDHFTTALANRHASRASGNGDFCRNSETLLRLALDARPGELVALASDVEERPFGVGATCGERFEPARPPVVDAPAPVATWRTQDGDNRMAYAEAPMFDPADPSPPSPAYRAYEQAADAEAASPHIDPSSIREDPSSGRVPATLPAVAVAVAPSVPVSANPPVIAVAEPVVLPQATAAPVVVETRAVAVAPAAAPSPAAALAAAAQALQAAAEALKASAVEAPVDSAPVIRERASPARKL